MRRLHRSLPLCCCVAVLAACAKTETPKADTAAAAAAAPAPAPAPAAATLADFAGKWNMRAVPEAGDTTATTYVLTASADSTWTLKYSNGLEVKAHAMASGDSVVIDAGPYASVRQKGLKVTTHGALRRDGDKLVGASTAHYNTTKPDSVLRLRMEGTRAQ